MHEGGGSPDGGASEVGLDLSFEPLSGREIAQAYPLIRELAPEMTLKRWQDYAETIADAQSTGGPQRGFLAARSSAGYLLGLCCYRVDLDLRDGMTLTVDDVVVPGILGQRQITEALFQAVEGLAQRYGCSSIHISCPVKVSWLFQLARHKDYWRCRWRFCKRL